MKWMSLFNRIGKQPISVTQRQDVFAVMSYRDLQVLADKAKAEGGTVKVPLKLKFGTGRQRMWFIYNK